MFFEEIGTLPLGAIKLEPDLESCADGSMIAFDIGSEARLLVSSIDGKVMLITKRGNDEVTYPGCVSQEELGELKNQFFGGSENV